MSHKPGMTNFPEQGTIRAFRGMCVEAAGPRAVIRSPLITILLRGTDDPLEGSITVQPVSTIA